MSTAQTVRNRTRGVLNRWLTRSLYLSVGYNAIGALGMALPQVFYPILGVSAPNHPVYQAVAVLAVALFGLDYFLQARTERRDRTFLTMAVLSKRGYASLYPV